MQVLQPEKCDFRTDIAPVLSGDSTFDNSTNIGLVPDDPSVSYTDNQINSSSYCLGKPRTLVSSHTGSITLAVSLQEPVIFLPSLPSTPSNRGRRHGNLSSMTSDNGISNDCHLPVNSSTKRSTFSQPLDMNHMPYDSSTQTHDGRRQSLSDFPPTMLRGSVILKLTKPTKVKSLSIGFYGMCKTSWVHATRVSVDDTLHAVSNIQDNMYIDSHWWEFSSSEDKADNANTTNTENVSTTQVYSNLFGADVAIFKSQPDQAIFKDENSRITHSGTTPIVSDGNNPIAVFAPSLPIKRKLKQPNFKGTSALMPAGEYIYHFALAIDAKTPESISTSNGVIKYVLVPKLVRPGPFALNLSGTQDINLVRSPPNNCEGSPNNPIVISKSWDARLHYEIVVPQKFMPLGSSIPITIKLTPLEKVTVHKIRIHIVETIEYTCSIDTNIKHFDRSLALLLYEKEADPLQSSYQECKSKRLGNILMAGPLDRGCTTTTIDCIVPFLSDGDGLEKIPPQYLFKTQTGNKANFIHPDATSWPYLKIRHRIIVILRLSKKDDTTDKRRSFEVKVDTPINFLSKYCIQESVNLPEYNPDQSIACLAPVVSKEYDSSNAIPIENDFQENEQLNVSELPPDYTTATHDL